MFLNQNIGTVRNPFFTLPFSDPMLFPLTMGNAFSFTATADFTLGNPVGETDSMDGIPILLEIIQDGVGSRLITFDTQYQFSADIPTFTLTTTPAARDLIGLIYRRDTDKWMVVAKSLGYV